LRSKRDDRSHGIQRPEQQSVDDTEDCRVCADTERDDQDSGSEESCVMAESSECITDVASEVSQDIDICINSHPAKRLAEALESHARKQVVIGFPL
jgi:hypothetical protein